MKIICVNYVELTERKIKRYLLVLKVPASHSIASSKPSPLIAEVLKI